MPKRHRAACEAGIALESWPECNRAAVRRAFEVVKAGGLLVLLGPWGTGKSQLAACLCHWAALAAGKTVMYRRCADLLAQVRTECYGEGKSDAELVSRLSRLGMLVLDEMHYRRWSADEALWIVRILDHRYGELVPTVLASNLTPDAFQTSMDPGIIDRMRQQGAVVELTGPSLRA